MNVPAMGRALLFPKAGVGLGQPSLIFCRGFLYSTDGRKICDPFAEPAVCIGVPVMGRGALLFPRAGVGFDQPSLTFLQRFPLHNRG